MAETSRDVNNHVLFEVATEVANRGMQLVQLSCAAMYANTLQLAVSTRCSNRRRRSRQLNMARHTHSLAHGTGTRLVRAERQLGLRC